MSERSFSVRPEAGTERAPTPNRLTVGAADDRAEVQADQLAARALRSLSAPLPTASGGRAQRSTQPVVRRSTPLATGIEEAVDADTDQRIRRAVGHGEPLPDQVRQPMEQAFGRSFDQVGVHTGAESEELNRRVQARAFTVGDDVFLGAGEPVEPTHTLAHELAHVTQEPGRVRRIRRLVGFEYEIDEVETWKVKKAGKLTEATDIEPTAKGYMARQKQRESLWIPMKKGEVLAEAGDVEVTADEAMTGGSNLELRTKAIDETDAARVRAAATDLADLAGGSGGGIPRAGIQAMQAATPHSLRASELGMANYSPTAFLRSNYWPAPHKGKVQATTGIRLERLPDLIRNAFAVANENPADAQRRAEGRQALTGWDTTVANPAPPGPILRIMGAAPAKAAQALASHTASDTSAPAPTRELQGLLALLIAYMDMAEQGLVRSYSKTIAPVMARTDFATMFTMLTATDRDYYAAGGGRNFSALLVAAGYSTAQLDQAVYSAGITESKEPNDWYTDLTRRNWLESIPSKAPKPGKKDKPGKDKLTPAHFPTRRGRKEIEGLGSYASKTDTVDIGGGASIQVPIIELRSLPTMDPATFIDFAEKLARLVAYLNTDLDKTYGEA